MKLRVVCGLILALIFSGVSAPASFADDVSGTTSETDNYGSLSGSATAKQGFQAGLSNYLGGNNSFTVEAWILPADSMSATTGTIFAKTDMVQYEIASGTFQAIFNASGGGWRGSISTSIKARLGEWQHVAFAKSTNTLSLYLNGQLVYQLTDATNIPTALNNTSTYTSVGSNPWNGSINQTSPAGNLFAGGMDEVKVWTTARTQSEIQISMRSKVASNSAGLASYWDFNGGATSVIHDRTGLMDLTAYGTPAPIYPDVKTNTVSGNTSTYTFPRTYLNGLGGFKVPVGVTRVDALVVGGGGGGGNNVGAGGAGGGGYYISNASVSSGDLLAVKVGYGGAGGRYLAGGSLTYDGNDLMNGQSGDSSTITIGANTYLGGAGGGGHTIWSTNYCNGTGTPSVWSVGGTSSGTGGTGYNGGAGGIPNSNQALANGATGYTSAFGGGGIFYGSGGGAGGGWNGNVVGNGANSKGGTGGASSGNPGGNGATLSGAGGGGGSVSCALGGSGGSGVVYLSMAAYTAAISNISTATYKTSTSLVATVTFSGRVTFFSQGKRIGGCINVATTGSGPYTATCNWKPALRGSVALTAIYTPTASPANAMNLSWGKIFVLNRSGNR
jgi:hypothetical protein